MKAGGKGQRAKGKATIALVFVLLTAHFSLAHSSAIEARAVVLARAFNVQTAAELRSLYLDLQRRFIQAYPFPDQLHLRRMMDFYAIAANAENEMLLQFYEKVLGDKGEMERFLKKVTSNQ